MECQDEIQLALQRMGQEENEQEGGYDEDGFDSPSMKNGKPGEDGGNALIILVGFVVVSFCSIATYVLYVNKAMEGDKGTLSKRLSKKKV